MLTNKRSTIWGKGLNHLLFIFLSLSTILPFILVISISLTSREDISSHGFSLIPPEVSFVSYEYIMANSAQLIQSYMVSFFVTGFGTFVSVFIMALTGYALSRRDFRFRSIITFYIFFTMLFNGGLVPYYILMVKYLNLDNTIWALIIPGLANAFHIIMLRTFFQKLPVSIFDSAKIDGASEYTIFFRIVLPLSKPVLATVSLFGVLQRWNAWFNAMLYITDKDLYPLQYLLQRIIMDMQFVRSQMEKMPASALEAISDIPGDGIRMAMVVVAAGPMLIIFPFFQKYFVEGLTIGSVKG